MPRKPVFQVRKHAEACGCDNGLDLWVVWDTQRLRVVQHYRRAYRAEKVAALGNRAVELGMTISPR